MTPLCKRFQWDQLRGADPESIPPWSHLDSDLSAVGLDHGGWDIAEGELDPITDSISTRKSTSLSEPTSPQATDPSRSPDNHDRPIC